MSELIRKAFARDGLLAVRFPGYQPRVSQIQMSLEVARVQQDGGRLMVEAPTGCHVAGQPILLADGRVKPVEDVLVGDVLMGPDGKGREVQRLARGLQETAWVRPVKGDPWRVNMDHVLTLVRTGVPKNGARKDSKVGVLVDVTVREYLRWSKTQKHLHKLLRVGVESFESSQFWPLPIAPYHLGLLLGDGSLGKKHGSVSICKLDPEIESACHDLAKAFGLRVRTYRRPGQATHFIVGGARAGRTANPLIRLIKQLELCVKSGEKFIPRVFKTAPRVYRLEILAGLIDTDGSLTSGGFEFTSKSERLANDVVFVARSLGLAAYVKPSVKRWQNGEGVYFRVFISGDCSVVPCRIPRKKAPVRKQIKDVLKTGFVVERTGIEENYFGFSLEGDGRYLLGDFTVTHNTGKSVSYLVPSIERALKGERVMVVTAGIALQEQLIRKDLPLLHEILPEPFTFAIAKGLNNYLCSNSFEDADGEYRMVGFKEDHEREQWPVIQEWAADTSTGDVSELPFEIDGRIRLKVTTTSDECLGQSCPKVGVCLARDARKAARGAQIVVTNYHLFFADMSAKANDPEAGPLPAYRHVVMDEAHEAAEIARDFFGFRISSHSVRRAGRYLQGNTQLGIPQCSDKSLKQELGRATDAFFQSLERASKHPSYKGRIEGPGLFDPEPLNALLRRVSSAYGDAMLSNPPQAGMAALAIGIDRLSAIRDQLSLASLNQDGDRFVYFIERDPPAVSMKPIDVAPMLKKHLFEREGVKSVSMCSATLASSERDGERFEYFANEFGAGKHTELAVDSPFDFSHQCLLYLPRRMREPNDPDFHRDVSSTVLDVATAAGGRTLGLFTSFKVLREVRAYLERMHVPWRVLAQGDAPRSRLVQQFKDDETSVLLGCDSFWQGVDVPGPALSAVVIDKIPFPHHDDPVMGAIQQRDKQWFGNRALPQACIAIKQGFGRLIRTSTDRGVVAIVDPRITGKGYGKKIERALPSNLPRTRELTDVQRFFTR